MFLTELSFSHKNFSENPLLLMGEPKARNQEFPLCLTPIPYGSVRVGSRLGQNTVILDVLGRGAVFEVETMRFIFGHLLNRILMTLAMSSFNPT